VLVKGNTIERISASPITVDAKSDVRVIAASNSVRRDLEALGVLDSPSSMDALLGIDPAAMTDEQLDATLALMQRRQADWAHAEAERSGEIELVEMEVSASD
jgi:hypothetical protein